MKNKRYLRILLPVLWMVLIYFASSQQKVAVTNDFLFSFIIFKSLHLIEYGILFLLWRFALQGTPNAGTISAVIAVIYGATDELHQSFVPTRTGRIRDVFIDTLGVVLAWQLFWPRIKNKLERG
jgi:VanZ family protein